MSFVISLLSTHTTYVISVLTVSERRGFKLDARQQRELGGHPGFLQLRTRAGTSREISTATSRALRLHSHVRARASASGKECGKKKKSQSHWEGSAGPRAQQPSSEEGDRAQRAELRAGGHVRPPATRSRPAVTVPPLPVPTKAVSPAAALTRAAPGPTPPRRAHFLSGQIQSPSLTRKFLVDILDASSTAAHSDVPHRSRGASRRGCPRAAGPALRCWEWGGRRSDDEGHPGREPAAAVKKRRPRPRRSARGSAPRRPHRVPEQALRRQPGLVAIAASRAPRSVP